MYLVRLGLLDGRSGLRFCFYHAWYEVSVGALRARGHRSRARGDSMKARLARRAFGDILSVSRHASPVTAAAG